MLGSAEWKYLVIFFWKINLIFFSLLWKELLEWTNLLWRNREMQLFCLLCCLRYGILSRSFIIRSFFPILLNSPVKNRVLVSFGHDEIVCWAFLWLLPAVEFLHCLATGHFRLYNRLDLYVSLPLLAVSVQMLTLRGQGRRNKEIIVVELQSYFELGQKRNEDFGPCLQFFQGLKYKFSAKLILDDIRIVCRNTIIGY